MSESYSIEDEKPSILSQLLSGVLKSTSKLFSCPVRNKAHQHPRLLEERRDNGVESFKKNFIMDDRPRHQRNKKRSGNDLGMNFISSWGSGDCQNQFINPMRCRDDLRYQTAEQRKEDVHNKCEGWNNSADLFDAMPISMGDFNSSEIKSHRESPTDLQEVYCDGEEEPKMVSDLMNHVGYMPMMTSNEPV